MLKILSALMLVLMVGASDAELRSDLNGDGYVNAVDLAMFSEEWLAKSNSIYDEDNMADATYYIDNVSGNDTTGDGSSGTPWATLDKAMDEAEANCSAGDTATIYLMPSETGYGRHASYGIWLSSAASDHIHWVFDRWTGQAGTVTIDGDYSALAVASTVDGLADGLGSVTVRNITLKPGSSCTSGYAPVLVSGDCDITIEDTCAIDYSSISAPTAVFYLKPKAGHTMLRSLSIDGIDGPGSAAVYSYANVSGAATVTIQNVEHNGTGHFATFYDNLDTLIVLNCDYVHNTADNTGAFVDATAADGISWFEVRNCTATGTQGGIGLEYNADHVWIEGNDIEVDVSASPMWGIKVGINEAFNGFNITNASNSVVTGFSGAFDYTGLAAGDQIRVVSGTNTRPGYYFISSVDSSSQVTLDANATDGGGAATDARIELYPALSSGKVRIINNSVNIVNDNCHALLFGVGFDGGEVAYNTFTGGDFTMVIKGDSAYIHHNKARGVKAMLITRGSKNNVVNNTLIGTADYALAIGMNQDSILARNNIVRDNILVAESSCDYVIDLGTRNVSDVGLILDNNCYHTDNASGEIINADSTAYTSIGAAVAAEVWSDNGGNAQDAISAETDPDLDGNYDPQNRDIHSIASDQYIGATAPEELVTLPASPASLMMDAATGVF